MNIGEEQFFEVPVVGQVGLTFRDVDVYPTTDGAVAVGITVDVDYSASGETDGTGIVWLKRPPMGSKMSQRRWGRRGRNRNRVMEVESSRVANSGS